MTKYTKYFETHSAYNTYINGNNKILPNVSYCDNMHEVHYNSAPSRILTAIYNIPTTANPISLYLDNFPNEIESVLVTRPNGTTFQLSESDLVEYDSITNYGDPYMAYQFDMTGEYTFEYTFKPNITTFTYNLFYDNPYVISVNIPNCITTIFGIEAMYSAFGSCDGLTSVTIPNSVTIIEDDAFSGCRSLTSVTIPSSVTTMGTNVFRFCENLEHVTVEAITPPTLGSAAFMNNANTRKIYVPAGSVSAYKAATGWSSYPNSIFAII